MHCISGYKAMKSFALCLAETTAQRPARDVGLRYLRLPILVGAARLLRLPEKHIPPAGTRASAGLRARLGALGDSRTKRESQHPCSMGTDPHLPTLCTAAASPSPPAAPQKHVLLGLLHLRAAVTHRHGEARFLLLKQHLS